VGRTKDSSGNELAFLHLKLKLSDGNIASALYKQEGSANTKNHYLTNSDKKVNGAYLWSCGFFTDGT
jgi:hypothetical protein